MSHTDLHAASNNLLTTYAADGEPDMKQSQAGNNNVMDQSQESAWGGHSWHSQFEGRNAQPASGRNTAMDRSMVEMSRIDGLIKK